MRPLKSISYYNKNYKQIFFAVLLMNNLSLEDFVGFYIEAVSEAVQGNHLPDLDSFYKHIFKRVYEKTGLSVEEIKSLHHPFHWGLFLGKNSPLELIPPRKMESPEGKELRQDFPWFAINYRICVRSKNSSLEKTELAKDILKKYRTLLQQRLDKILKCHN